MRGTFQAVETCSIIHAEGAEVLATYADQFYAGTPAVTVNRYGKGNAYFIAPRLEQRFLDAFYGSLISELSVLRAVDAELPPGVTAQLRTDGEQNFIFLMNFNKAKQCVVLDSAYDDLLSGKSVGPAVDLSPYGVMVLKK